MHYFKPSPQGTQFLKTCFWKPHEDLQPEIRGKSLFSSHRSLRFHKCFLLSIEKNTRNLQQHWGEKTKAADLIVPGICLCMCGGFRHRFCTVTPWWRDNLTGFPTGENSNLIFSAPYQSCSTSSQKVHWYLHINILDEKGLHSKFSCTLALSLESNQYQGCNHSAAQRTGLGTVGKGLQDTSDTAQTSMGLSACTRKRECMSLYTSLRPSKQK